MYFICRMEENLKETVNSLPHSPGVYIMKNNKGVFIYIGKAKDLNKRVRSYFTGQKNIKTQILVKNISAIEFIVTGDEFKALILENNLIKKWTPKYNIDLKDDKTYPSICITNEEFPRIFKTRNVRNDGSSYYGPFASVAKLDTYLELINNYLPLRKCRGKLRKRESPCLYYHIGKCSAPCCGKISASEYRSYVKKAENLLKGKTKGLKQELEREMMSASRALNYERAALMRDFLESVRMVEEQAEHIEFTEDARDYIACFTENNISTFSVFQIRLGKLSGRYLFRTRVYGDEEDAFTEFFLHYYNGENPFPDSIFVSGKFDLESLHAYVNNISPAPVAVAAPDSGKHLKIINMAMENAREDVRRRTRKEKNVPGLIELKELLSLPALPVRIEGFDIAQLSGKFPVASLVSFYNGVPDKKNYRKFHVKSLNGAIDDYESIREVVARRYTRVLNENLEKPDLIVIDGGKGQVNAASQILTAIGLPSIPVIGLAKRNEEIFLPDKSTPVILPETSEALRIIQAVRDETHRFATSFNQQLRSKEVSLSTLEKIPGIGPKRSQSLIKAFGSVEELSYAAPEKIAEIDGITMEAAENIQNYFTKKFDKP